MKTKTKTEREYEFDLILSGPDALLELADPIVDAFFEVAGGDITPGVCCGVPQASCTRAAPTMKDAILAAIADIRKVGHGVDVIGVQWPSLVTQADIARMIGKSRQMIQHYLRGGCGPGGFPPPARQGMNGQPLWQWSDVAAWLAKNQLAPPSLVRDAEAVETINSVLDYTRRTKQHAALVREVKAAMAGKKTA